MELFDGAMLEEELQAMNAGHRSDGGSPRLSKNATACLLPATPAARGLRRLDQSRPAGRSRSARAPRDDAARLSEMEVPALQIGWKRDVPGRADSAASQELLARRVQRPRQAGLVAKDVEAGPPEPDPSRRHRCLGPVVPRRIWGRSANGGGGPCALGTPSSPGPHARNDHRRSRAAGRPRGRHISRQLLHPRRCRPEQNHGREIPEA
jgi:hypothetical protein